LKSVKGPIMLLYHYTEPEVCALNMKLQDW